MDCNLGSEIGQKMRSAVKAKLLELGTGGSAGFIDDELPDYVMVMVANKRTKQQMNAELNLFLGDQTDLFVTWLHEVLQKLQEVTLPASTAVSKKRKSRQGEAPKSKDKDKKTKDKRDKSKDKGIRHRKSGDELPESATVPAISSITDVFAEELLEKAKKTLDVDSSLKDELLQKKKKRKSDEPSTEKAVQDFDIPTMSEISSTTTVNTTSGNREKDMAELAEIQRKIYAAKQHLRQIGELGDESDEDENENDLDVPPVAEEPTESPVERPEVATDSNLNSKKAKSPIVFNRTRTPEPVVPIEKPKPKPSSKPEVSERRSVHERLGCKPPTSVATPEAPPERPQRVQKEVELYVPAHRRQKEEAKKLERGRERGQSSRRRERIRHTANISPVANRSPSSSPESSYKHRIGSRVIVAVNKPPEPSDDEDLLEKPVNSVIKIKPRPVVSPRRQACKNLLLRAVADAQRSTILAKTVTVTPPTARPMSDEPEIISTTLGKRPSTEVSAKELLRRNKRELVVNVLHRDAKRIRPSIQRKDEIDLRKQQEDDEDEYVPSLNVGDYEAYVPQLVQRTDLDVDIDMHVEKSTTNSASAVASKTQFVVTLNGDKSIVNAVPYRSGRRLRKRTPSPQVSSTSSSTIQQVIMEPTSTTGTGSTSSPNNNDNKRNSKSKRGRSSSHSSPSTSSNTPPPKSSSNLHRSEVIRSTQEIKKIIIKNDADDDEADVPQPQRRTSRKRRSSSSTTTVTVTATSTSTSTSTKEMKNGSKGKEEFHRSTTPPLPPKQQEKREEKSTGSTAAEATASLEAPSKVKHTPIRFKLKHEEAEEVQHPKKRRSQSHDRESSTEPRRISIRNADDRKYDNLPSLSAVSVDSTVLKVSKPKERCKYHPNCTKQFCEYYHPSAPCKSFPNCKFADKCMYSHPKCKFDSACMSIDCNFAHSGPRDLSHVQLVAPPLSSHVIPVQNYKSISAQAPGTTATTMCKYYPNCTKVGCTFYHPKPCRYGKNCVNKIECIFYHPEMQSKFKWVASLG